MIMQMVLPLVIIGVFTFFDLRQMRKKKQKREVIVYGFLVTAAAIGVIMVSLDFDIPNPVKATSILLDDWVKWLHDYPKM